MFVGQQWKGSPPKCAGRSFGIPAGNIMIVYLVQTNWQELELGIDPVEPSRYEPIGILDLLAPCAVRWGSCGRGMWCFAVSEHTTGAYNVDSKNRIKSIHI